MTATNVHVPAQQRDAWSARLRLSASPRLWLVAVVGVHVIFVVAAMTHPINDDVPRYWAIASTHLRPYLDFPAEYPVLAVVLLRAIGAATHSMEGFGRVLVAINACADLAIWLLISRYWSPRTGLRYGVMIAALLPLLLTKMDLLTMLAALVMLVAATRRRWPLAGSAIAAAVGLKLWPVLVGVAAVAAVRGKHRRAAAGWTLAGLAVFLVVSLAAGGVDGLQQVLTFRGAHHPQIESTVGAIGRLFTPGPAIEEGGAWRAVGLPAWLDPVFSALSLGLATVVAAWVGHRRGAALSACAAVVTLLALAPVLSPQYVAWAVPALAIAAPVFTRRTVFVMAAATMALTYVTTYLLYSALIAGSVPADLLVVARDLLIGAIAVTACRAVGQSAPAGAQQRALPQPT